MSNFDLITKEILRGRPGSGVEDFAEMYRRSSTINRFWADKRVDFSKIECPTYIRGSDVSNLHNMGSVRAWLQIPHNNKWIQWGSYQEWFELYSMPESETNLTMFFDRYLRNINNGWETTTPKVRWDILKFGDSSPLHDIILEDYPVPNTDYRRMFLTEGGRLGEACPSHQVATYNSEVKGDFAEFAYQFDNPTRLLGLPKATLYMSCDTRDDFVVFLIIRKRDKDGNDMMHLNFPFEASPIKSMADIDPKDKQSLNMHYGPMGILRASHRRIDQSRNIHPQVPFHPHDREEKVAPGTIVKLEIGIWPIATDFEAGESISFRVSIPSPLL